MAELSNVKCVYCGDTIEWLSRINGTGLWEHVSRDGVTYTYCIGKNTRAEREHYQIGDPPFGNDAIDYPQNAGPRLQTVLARQAATQHLWDSGLLWLINAAILHPRGYAMTASIDEETGRVLELFVQGDGSEPWCFGEDTIPADEERVFESDESYRRFAAGEIEREAAWSPKLNPSEIEFVPPPCMQWLNPGYGQEYKFCYEPKGHLGGCVYSFRREGFPTPASETLST